MVMGGGGVTSPLGAKRLSASFAFMHLRHARASASASASAACEWLDKLINEIDPV